MSVVFEATFKAKDDTYDELHATLTAILPDTAKYEGAELISCSADPADKTFYTVSYTHLTLPTIYSV